MACQDDWAGKTSKPRFKGIENFLRRVAFNLGNSPSQTEVKIISCIPIDVTDLQQKIIHLEKQVEEKSSRKTSATRASSASGLTAGIPRSSSRERPTAVTAAHETGVVAPRVDRAVDNCSIELHRRSLSPLNSAISFTVPAAQPQISTLQYNLPPLPARTRISELTKRQILKKGKKMKRHSPLIYYAQTVTSPFEYNIKETAKKETEPPIDLSYFTDVIHKQYRPEVYMDEFTSGSQLSAPVCRDGAAGSATARECDACSCCRGCFHDTDLDNEPYRFLDTCAATNIDCGNVYNNSSLYDLIPVKEKPETKKKDIEKYTKREPKFQCESRCWSSYGRSKSLCKPATVNYAYALPPQRYVKHRPVKSLKRRERLAKVLCRHDVPRNTSVECGNIYTKQVVSRINSVYKRSVECLTLSVNDTECQTDGARDIQTSSNTTTEENKTETTLNQIKSILQSVLSYVKTNTLAKSQTEEKGRKEEDMQRPSLAPDGSRLLSSYRYSPFSVDPFMASCSRGLPTLCPVGPISSSQAKDFPTVIPTPHFKCMQNFPVFIQQGNPRQFCTSCNRGTGPSGHVKQTSTYSLSLSEDKRSKETENLIKEIYKSMALNMNVPQKRISHTNFSHFKTPDLSRNHIGEPVVSNVMTFNPKARPSDRSLKGQRIQTLMSTATASMATSSTRTSPQSRTDDQRSMRFHNSNPPRFGPPKSVHESTTTTSHRRSRIVEGEPFSEESDTESASDVTIVSAAASVRKPPASKEPDKTGIFSKLFGSVFKKRRRKGSKKEASTSAVDSEASDSDDYETIYSQKVDLPSRPKHVTYASTPRRSRRSVRMRIERPRRTKYMDPENRRYWDQQLSFHTTPPPGRQPPAPRTPPPPARHPAAVTPPVLRTPTPVRRTPPSQRGPGAARAPPGRRASQIRRPVPHGITLRTRGRRYQTMDTRYVSLDPPHPPFKVKKEVDYPPNVPYREKPRSPRLTVGLKGSNKKLSWLKKHHCGEQWKKLLSES